MTPIVRVHILVCGVAALLLLGCTNGDTPAADMRAPDGSVDPAYDFRDVDFFRPPECVACDDQKPLCDLTTTPPCRICGKPGDDVLCEQRSAAQPFCDDAGSGRCVACRDSKLDADCALSAPGFICEKNQCRACQKNAECQSSVCDVSTGKCVARANVVYVEQGKPCPGTGDDATPFCDIKTALQSGKVTGSRTYVRVRASGTTNYGAVTIPSTLSKVTLIGEELAYSDLLLADGARKGKVVRLDGGSLTAAMTASAGDVTIDSIELVQGKPDVLCNGASTKLTLRRSWVNAAAQFGIRSIDCTLVLDSNVLRRNNSSALSLEGATKYTVTNNFIVDNNTELLAAVQMLNTASGSFLYNTIANNRASTGVPGGIDCGTNAQTLKDSIFFGNSAPTIMGKTSQLFRSCTLNNVVVGSGDQFGGITVDPVFVDASNADPIKRDYKLQMSSGCCIDKGADLTVKTDFFGKVRGPKPDIGAHEYP